MAEWRSSPEEQTAWVAPRGFVSPNRAPRSVLGDRDADALARTADELRKSGATVSAIEIDVSDRASVDALVALALDRHGRVDVMANIAGVRHRGKVIDLDDAEVHRIMSSNFMSALYGCQAAVRAMSGRNPGSIINMASGIIDTPSPDMGLYAMSKAAVVMLTMALAVEVGGAGIRVNALAPGIIETNFAKDSFRRADGSVDPEQLAGYRSFAENLAPLGRIGVPDDLGTTALFLASDASSFMTGQILRVNGGVAMPW